MREMAGMDELLFKMMQWSQQGFFCSQILLLLAMERLQRDNPELIRAMGGLNGGVGFSGRLCGALTGGACLISLYVGKGEAEEQEDSQVNDLIRQLADWFQMEACAAYAGCNCTDILEENPNNRMTRCPQLVQQTFEKATALLTQAGYDLATGRRDE